MGKDESKELVLIFDDFELSQIDIVSLLGVINEYCENKRLKLSQLRMKKEFVKIMLDIKILKKRLFNLHYRLIQIIEKLLLILLNHIMRRLKDIMTLY